MATLLASFSERHFSNLFSQVGQYASQGQRRRSRVAKKSLSFLTSLNILSSLSGLVMRSRPDIGGYLAIMLDHIVETAKALCPSSYFSFSYDMPFTPRAVYFPRSESVFLRHFLSPFIRRTASNPKSSFDNFQTKKRRCFIGNRQRLLICILLSLAGLSYRVRNDSYQAPNDPGGRNV